MLQPFDMAFDFSAGESGGVWAVRVSSQQDAAIGALIYDKGTCIRAIQGAGSDRLGHIESRNPESVTQTIGYRLADWGIENALNA